MNPKEKDTWYVHGSDGEAYFKTFTV